MYKYSHISCYKSRNQSHCHLQFLIPRNLIIMGLKVDIISKEIIKPSSPTPHHLKHLKLSFLDQLAPPVYIPMILFYDASQLGSEMVRSRLSDSFRRSLSETLVRYYPLAGRIGDDFSVDCEDTGVEYIETEVHAELSQAIEDPVMEELSVYLPRKPYGGGVGEILLAVQVNYFDCGGAAVGVCISHKVADGLSLVNFMNAWALACRGGGSDGGTLNPTFDAAQHFPPRDLSGFNPVAGITQQKIITRRFVFDKKKLAALKEAVASNPGSQVKDPTRVEAVSAFIWKHFMDVATSKSNAKTEFAAVHAVNLRPRSDPPMQDHCFGNIWRFIFAAAGDGGEYHDLVNQIRSAIRNVDSKYVKKLKSGDAYLDYIKREKERFYRGEIRLCNFSSWCRFPVYEVDYGWGGPVWVSTTAMPFNNVVILMSTKCGEGIEAWVNMAEEDMAMLERDHKLLSIVSNGVNA